MTVTTPDLTDAELRVLPLVVEGLPYREVAATLHLSRRTVESHVASMFRKLGVRTRGELTNVVWRTRSRSHDHCATCSCRPMAATA